MSSNAFEGWFHIHVATDCNATSRRIQSQRVWWVSCSQSQISDCVRYFSATIRRVASRRSVYAGELQVASTKTHKNVFYIIYFFADEGVPVSCVASRRSVYVLQFQILNLRRCVAMSCYVYVWLND